MSQKERYLESNLLPFVQSFPVYRRTLASLEVVIVNFYTDVVHVKLVALLSRNLAVLRHVGAVDLELGGLGRGLLGASTEGEHEHGNTSNNASEDHRRKKGT